jgi:mediator of RNA polymerase II transcription subunit 18, fungi type
VRLSTAISVVLQSLTPNRFKSQVIEESCFFFNDDIEYVLTRWHKLPPADNLALPAWDALIPVDPTGGWVFLIRTHVFEENSPDKMKRALDDLTAAQKQLSGIFEFKVVDRRAHDTRLVQKVSSTPIPLPQTVRA